MAWTSPAGFPVVHEVREPKEVRLASADKRIRIHVEDQKRKIDWRGAGGRHRGSPGSFSGCRTHDVDGESDPQLPSPSQADKPKTVRVSRGQRLQYDEIRYQTMEVGLIRVLKDSELERRDFGAVQRLFHDDYYSDKLKREKIQLKAGMMIQYLQYRAEGECFLRMDGRVMDGTYPLYDAESRRTGTYYFEVSPDPGYVGFPEAFFAKYKEYIPPFKKMTEFKGRVQAALRTPEFTWSFKTPQRIDSETYDVWGGYYCGGLCATHCDYRVVRKNGTWIVQSTGLCTSS